MKYIRPSRNKKHSIWHRDKFECQLKISPYCIPKLTLDNATNNHRNLVTACFPCNNLKADKEYIGKLTNTEIVIVKDYKKERKKQIKKIIKSMNKNSLRSYTKKGTWRFKNFKDRNLYLYGIE